ncbi:helix-turn-helix domain-containing protein [Sphingomonas sp. DT-204]|uniref:helix-turn-helix domain-containing protein n=1 Tax=Sphingomonas sp. DT-204 TaxID=3396166 RepID=UPI003F1A9C81
MFRSALDEQHHAGAAPTRVTDGQRQSLGASGGIRHVYDSEIAIGGWEFYQLRPGLALLIVDMVTCQYIPRRHSFEDQLVLSAVLNGGVEIRDPSGIDGKLANGHCTLYGMGSDGGFETLYEPDRTLKWVSVVIDRDLFGDVVQIMPDDLPPTVAAYVEGQAPLPYHNVPLSPAASLAAHQILECAYRGSVRRAFLTAKALELACLILFSFRSNCEDQLNGVSMSGGDFDKLARAKRYIERSLDEPWTIAELASVVGLTRQKLQMGFRRVYGDTVGQMRDRLRLERALELVRGSQMSMIEIALETGYEHPPSFTRAFKAAFGVAPIQMRRMAQEGVLIGHLDGR